MSPCDSDLLSLYFTGFGAVIGFLTAFVKVGYCKHSIDNLLYFRLDYLESGNTFYLLLESLEGVIVSYFLCRKSKTPFGFATFILIFFSFNLIGGIYFY